MPIVRTGTLKPTKVVKDETFFDFPGSDIILRSCDSRDFPLPKLHIFIYSPVLGQLIRSVSTTSDTPNGEGPKPLPVVKLPESGTTLHNLLTFISPVLPVLPPTSEKIMELLAAAQKYQMKSVSSHIRGIIARQDPPFIRPETAHDIYFLAQKHELLPEVVQAARVTLRLPMALQRLGDKLEFPGLTGAYLHELWKYHQRVRSGLKSGVLEFTNSGLLDDVKCLRCQTPEDLVLDDSPPRWLKEYIESIADAPNLFDPIAFQNDWACHLKETMTTCSKACSRVDLSSDLRRAFWEALTSFVHTTVEKVRRDTTVTKHHRDN
jgi:hypothetical protein